MKELYYQVAGHVFSLVTGEQEDIEKRLQQYEPFAVQPTKDVTFSLQTTTVPPSDDGFVVEFRQEDEDQEIVSGRMPDGRSRVEFWLRQQRSAILILNEDYSRGEVYLEKFQKFGVNKKGEIRFGLAAIKGLGDGVAQAIIDEREKNGPYEDLFDFVQRVNFSQINRKAFEALALSGGFDSFGIRREDFFAQNSKGESTIEIVMRYGQLYQAEKQQAQNSLFGSFDDLEIQPPTLPKSSDRWSDIERLNKERELVGIYLSAHPLDEYKIVLDNLCNTRCEELADIGNLTGREDITIGGIVTAVRTGFTKNGKPYGIVTLEDFEGSGELPLFGETWGDKSGFFTIGASVYITGKVRPRFTYNPDGPKDLGITGVEFLQTIKERAIDRITISLTTDLLDDQVVTELGELIAAHPGKTHLFFQLHDVSGKNHVLLKSTTKMVDVKSELIQFIEQTPALDYKIN